jgi:hypothetical protein
MITDQTTALPDDQHLTALLGLVKDLVALMADPKATQKRLNDLAERTDAAKAASAQALKDRADADRHMADTEAAIAAATERHGDEKVAHQARLAEERKDIEELARQADADRKAAALERAEATAIKNTITKKLAALQAA